MSRKLLMSLSMGKYERMLPRVFPGVARLEIFDNQGAPFWFLLRAASEQQESGHADGETPEVEWSDFGNGIEQRGLPNGRRQYRALLVVKGYGLVARLVVTYETQRSIAIALAPDTIRGALADARVFLQEEIELQLECNQLAAELAERIEDVTGAFSTLL